MAINVMHDVTAEKLAEHQKTEFLSALAHDLKTPLTAIKGVSQLMIRRLNQPEPPSGAWLTEELRRLDITAQRMANLVNELLDLEQLGSSEGLELVRAKIDIAELAGQVARELAATTTIHPIQVRGPDEPLIGQWDKERIGRVLANLIENAIKYSPDGGEITVDVRRAGRTASISVTDEGIGVPEAETARIFERFQRGTNVPASIRGTGVGLAYTRWVVAQHNGSLRIVSTPGRGSTFTVALPLDASVDMARNVVPA